VDNQDKQLMLQDWLRLVDFGEKAIKYNAEKGQVLDTMDITKKPGEKDKVGSYKRLSELDDFRFFSLGPVYVNCGIPFDVIQQFRDTLIKGGDAYDGPRLVMEFKKPILTMATGLGIWGNILEGIHMGPTGYDKLVKFMNSQTIRQKETQTYWTIKHVEVLIPDPMAVDRSEYSPSDPDKKAIIGLFLPSGNRYQVNTHVISEYPPVPLFRGTPDPTVVREGIAMLDIGKDTPQKG